MALVPSPIDLGDENSVEADPCPFEVVDLGAGSVVLLDQTIPSGLAPNACGSKDGWKRSESRSPSS